MVMLVYLDQALKQHMSGNELRSAKELYQAVQEGALKRVRPITMTVSTIVLGLLPIMIGGDGTGSQVMQRVAVSMVGA